MAFTDTPDPTIATITDAGRNALARATLGEISFSINSFAVGREGYQMANPVKVEPIDPSLTALVDQIFPTSGQQPILGFENPYPTTLVVNCKILPNDFNSAIGELGIWAIINNSTTPTEIGTEFLFAVAHLPIITKTLKQSMLLRVVIQF